MENYQKVSKWFVMLSVLYVITGIVMMVWPNLTIDLLGKALSIGMLVVGVAYIIIYFTKDHLQGIMTMDLTIGVVLAAFGAFMLFHADFVEMALPFAIGIVLMIGGISKIQYSFDMRKLGFSKWWLMLVAACVMLVLGMILVYNPFRDQILIYYIAIGLMLDGILSIVAVLLISHRLKQMAKGTTQVIVKGKNRRGDTVEGEAAVQQPVQNVGYGKGADTVMQVYDQSPASPAVTEEVIDAEERS